eukprot:COSAG05_NODE_4161_length_1647_cov_1.697028_2_plen_192_part_00
MVVGNEEDLQLGLGVPGADVEKESKLDPAAFFGMIDNVKAKFPNVKVIATTLREVHTTNRHTWSAVCWINGQTYVAPQCELDVYDRVGGGDGFGERASVPRSPLLIQLVPLPLSATASSRCKPLMRTVAVLVALAASGFFYGLLKGETPENALRLGWAHGALLTTYEGDTTMASIAEVEAFANGGSARIQR